MVDGPTPPAIFLTAPNGGEQWVAGKDYDITWNDLNVTGPIHLQYSQDNFDKDINEIATNLPDDHKYTWKVPPMYSETVKVKASWILDPTVSDASNADFSILNGGNCAPPPSITTSSLPDANETGFYSVQLSAVNGEGPISWKTLPDGDSVPGGLTLETNGLLHGTVDSGTAGDYNLHLQASDCCNPVQTDTANLSLKVTNEGGWGKGLSLQFCGYDLNWGGMTVLPTGETYAVGYGEGYEDIIFVKLDKFGNVVWTKTIVSSHLMSEELSIHDIAADHAGNLYIAGTFQLTVDFDPGDGVDNHSSSALEGYLAKYDPDGNYLGVKTWMSKDSKNQDAATYINKIAC